MFGPSSRIDRRSLIGGMGGFAACALCGPRHSHAAPGADKAGRIDVHHHYNPPVAGAFQDKFLKGQGPYRDATDKRPYPYAVWDVSADLEDMQKYGTDLAVLSVFTPGTGGTPADRWRLARDTNDFGARLVHDHPGRFALFASLPMPDVDGCLKEIAYGLDTLKAVGVAVYTDAQEKYLGDPAFAPIYQELDRRRAVVFVHPHSPMCCTNLVSHVPDTLIEYGAATTRTIASLVFTGTTVRYPNIKWIFSHGGGMMPYVIERFLGGTEAEIVPGIVTKGQGKIPLDQPPGTALAELRKLHYDTAQMSNPVALRALRTVVPVSQLLYGTDFWYRTAQETSKGLDTAAVFSKSELRAIDRGNALRLMPSLAHT